ncbi:MAG: 4-hydroxy-tetrahydrodipicolinate synthase [Bacteroidia bacterium]|nr:4-hydroxy-tetrahydrodipicolinate synthase [Bacteroidia bacterium]
MKKFHGTGVALVTPFNADGSVDFAGLRALVRHVSQPKGVDYLVILGTTGEPATMTGEEQARVIETILDENGGKLGTVLGCGGNNTAKIAAQIAEYTQKYEVDAFLSVAPYYNKPSQEGMYQHFVAVCKATDKPVILYNVPGRTSSNLLPATVLRIAAACPNASSIKEASGSLPQGMDLILNRQPGFSVLSGEDLLMLPMLGAGFDGVISVIANSHPVLFAEMVRAGLRNDFDLARKNHYQLHNLINLIFEEGNPAGVKAALAHLGICGPTVRLPLVQASQGLSDRIKKELAGIS